VDLRDYIRLLRRRWVVILVVLLACLAGAAGATMLQEKSYKSSTEVLVTLSAAALDEDTGSATYYLPDRVGTFAGILATPPAVSAAVESAGVPTDSGVAVAASVPPDTAVLTIEVVAASPAIAQAVANEYVVVLPAVLAELNQVTSSNELVFKTLRTAALPSTAFRPDPIVNGGIGLAAGLILGLCAAAMREALDRRIRDSRSIEDDLAQPLLGVVPRELRKVALPAQSHPHSLRSEAYRTVRTNLLFAGAGGMVRSLAITSPSAAEGKSALASNLAIVCAGSGQRVAVIDADLRRPTLHHQFGLSTHVGLTSVLNGSVALDDAVQQFGNQITVLTSGPIVRNPSELLGRPMLQQIIEKLGGSYDIVIVDTAPTLVVRRVPGQHGPGFDRRVLRCRRTVAGSRGGTTAPGAVGCRGDNGTCREVQRRGVPAPDAGDRRRGRPAARRSGSSRHRTSAARR